MGEGGPLSVVLLVMVVVVVERLVGAGVILEVRVVVVVVVRLVGVVVMVEVRVAVVDRFVVVVVVVDIVVVVVVVLVVVVVVVVDTAGGVRGQGAGLHHLASLLAALHSTKSAWSPLGCLSLI